jgi:hypothetical protein
MLPVTSRVTRGKKRKQPCKTPVRIESERSHAQRQTGKKKKATNQKQKQNVMWALAYARVCTETAA